MTIMQKKSQTARKKKNVKDAFSDFTKGIGKWFKRKEAITKSVIDDKISSKHYSISHCLHKTALALSAPASDVLNRQQKTKVSKVNVNGIIESKGGCDSGFDVTEATTPVDTVLPIDMKNEQSLSTSWFQLSGHPDSFEVAGPDTIWKKCTGGTEAKVYEALSQDPSLREIVPTFYREVEYNNEKFIELQDLLHNFTDPNVIDIKMGTRTFLESEVSNTFARADLYTKMIAVDPNAPTAEENEAKKVTKLRYMQFREEQSSTSTLGFRIDAMKFRGSNPVKDLQKVKTKTDVADTLSLFIGTRADIKQSLLIRLNEFKIKLEQSEYFKKHEVVGSSILIIYDDVKVNAWIIDFAKTRPVPPNVSLTHRLPWSPGNHEEGWLYGLDQLTKIIDSIDIPQSVVAEPSTTSIILSS